MQSPERELLEWSDARTAAIYLKPCTARFLNEEIGSNLTRKANNRPGTVTARGGGWLYHRHDLERVRAIMESLGCRAHRAASLLQQLKELSRRQMLAYLLEDVSLTSQDDATRRRFQ